MEYHQHEPSALLGPILQLPSWLAEVRPAAAADAAAGLLPDKAEATSSAAGPWLLLLLSAPSLLLPPMLSLPPPPLLSLEHPPRMSMVSQVLSWCRHRGGSQCWCGCAPATAT